MPPRPTWANGTAPSSNAHRARSAGRELSNSSAAPAKNERLHVPECQKKDQRKHGGQGTDRRSVGNSRHRDIDVAADAKSEREERSGDKCGTQAEKALAILTLKCDPVKRRRSNEQNERHRVGRKRKRMNDLRLCRKRAEGPAQHGDELKSQQRLGAGNDDARLGQHLLDSGFKWCWPSRIHFPYVRCVSTQEPSVTEFQNIPEQKRQRGEKRAGDDSNGLSKLLGQRNVDVEPERAGERQERHARKRADGAPPPSGASPIVG